MTLTDLAANAVAALNRARLPIVHALAPEDASLFYTGIASHGGCGTTASTTQWCP